MKIFDFLETFVKIVAGVCLFAVFALVTVQVASRFIFNSSVAAASELSIYAMIWTVFLGAAVAFRSNSHIAMDILKNRFPARIMPIADGVIFLLLAGFLCLIATEGFDLSMRAMRQTSPASKIPVGYITMAIPVGSILALVFLCEWQARQLHKARNRD